MGAVGHGDGDPHGFAEGDLQIGRRISRKHGCRGLVVHAAYRFCDAALLLLSGVVLVCAPF